MPHRAFDLAAGMLLMVSPGLAAAQEVVIPPDSAQSEIRAVLRAFYLHLEHKDWEALSPYVLSPKLLERRGSPGDLQMVTRDRARGRGSSHAVASPRTCPAWRFIYTDLFDGSPSVEQ